MKKPNRKQNRRQNQFSLFKPQVKFHGGALLYKKRKSMRPLSSKDSIHFVLRSQWAMGADSFLVTRNRKAIERTINRFSKKFGVRIYQQSINSNHIHILLRITNRILYRAFIKAISGKIASHVMGNQSFKLFSKVSLKLKTEARLNQTAKLDRKTESDPKTGDGSAATQLSQAFWQFRPFSRIVNWGKDFKTCVKYLKQNVLEALGFATYTPRKKYYSKWICETGPEFIKCGD